MTTISERLRAAGCHYGIPIERDTAEAADTIDALVAALEEALPFLEENNHPAFRSALAALALARKGGG